MHLAAGDNVLAVIVDARWLPVPPDGQPRAAPAAVDYLQPGGIYRDVTLRVVPEVFLSDVFARPADVLGARPRRGRCRPRSTRRRVPRGPVTVTAELLDGSRTIAGRRRRHGDDRRARGRTRVRLAHHRDRRTVALWSPDSPRLYTVRVTVAPAGRATAHRRGQDRLPRGRVPARRLLPQRPAAEDLRPEPAPAVPLSRAWRRPARLQRRDAEILGRELNCNMVRCSHYPQSPHFLDACDELGLMVWQEPPGWQYVGDAAWQDLVVQNVHDMVIRDRNRPSVIIWAHPAERDRELPRAVRADPPARRPAGRHAGRRPARWQPTRRPAGPRTCSPTTTTSHRQRQRQRLNRRCPGVPYLVSEAVGALDGPPPYRWIDPGAVLAEQALHARSGARHRPVQTPVTPACSAGPAIDYASLNGGNRIWQRAEDAGRRWTRSGCPSPAPRSTARRSTRGCGR